MDLNKKLIDQLSDLSRNIKSLTGEVRDNKNVISTEISQKEESTKEDKSKKELSEGQNKNFLKSLEGIFQKGIGQIAKSNLESNSMLKGALGAVQEKGIESALNLISSTKDKQTTPEAKSTKALGGILGKIPKFETGGVMDKTGLALVGEKGPEVVKLEKGSEVIPNDKSKEIASSIKTVDQSLTEKKGPTQEQIEKYRNSLIKDYPEFYGESPELVDVATEIWKNLNQYNTSDQIDNILSGSEIESFTRENKENLSEPDRNIEILGAKKEPTADEKLLDKKEKDKKEKSKLFEKAKNLADEKGVSDKGKNLLLSKGKDFLTGKLGEKDKDGSSSILGGKNELMSKGIGAATSILSNKEAREKGIEKLESLKKKKEVELEKSSMTVESLQLKKTPVKEEAKKEESPKVEIPKAEIPKAETPKTATEEKKEEDKKPKSQSVSSSEASSTTPGSLKAEDLAPVVSLLSRMVTLLEGPLSVETMESPFRPDSRRF